MPVSEIGRQLKASDLRPKQIVVIRPPGRDVAITMWVAYVDEHTVAFYSGVHSLSVINAIQADGTIVDDQDREVRVFEYLGEP